ncbi:hypothetical protein A5699_23650 [Mycobacterium sp. E802]|uniref:hypothetical protein n=1 Tax=Mycobacterium sp. E802 TaxID=1834152 RepID=UPI0007FC5251|nr:hypothetical protein [Mycobacterium sp. E802]OBG85591.1 hypothetical protein A5699_23650 [Mycobacterium sp. E802]
MSNRITADHDPAVADITLSNGVTSVFLSVLLLSGSDLARDDHQVATICWLADRDDSLVGLGTVGFDVSELGWTAAGFDAQKQFLLQVVDTAVHRHRWEVLSYQPDAASLIEYLTAFRSMIAAFPADACGDGSSGASVTADVRADRAQCPRHRVLLHNRSDDDAECCLICNDEPVD